MSDAGDDTGDDAVRARARLLSLLNHELRAPLARIAAQARAAVPDLDAIAANARRQLEWLSDLQQCARYELKAPELTPAPAYLQALLRQTVDNEEALRAVPALAVLDARLLEQALRKLRDHAAKPLTLHAAPLLAPALAAGAVMLRFSSGDDGPASGDAGRSDNDPAAGNDTWRDVTGSLADAAVDPGLLLAAHLVRAMGSRLQQSGDSMRFEIAAPLAEEDEAMPPAPRFVLPEPFGGGRALLLLEPHGAMRDYLSEILESAAFEVQYAAGDSRPALVLCADENVWKEVRFEDAPPVLLHAALPPQRPQDFVRVLYKPAPPALLLDAVREALREPQAISAPAGRR